jgi:internalin A
METLEGLPLQNNFSKLDILILDSIYYIKDLLIPIQREVYKSIFKGMTQIKTIAIQKCPRLLTLEGLNYCTILTELELSQCEKLDSLLGIESCIDLHRLRINLCNIRDISNVTKCVYLTIENCPEFISLASECDQLEKVKIKFCDNLVDLSSLSHCAHLRRLSIVGCNNLKQLIGISSCKLLHYLLINKCERLVHIDSCSYLHYLTLRNCKMLNDLSFIKKYDSLIKVHLDADSPLRLKLSKFKEILVT